MYVPFDTLESSARVWIYQSARKFTDAEKDTISQTLSAFTESWTAHGNPLKTSFAIFHDQFIVLAADEGFNEASGCSIDGAVRIIKEIDLRFSLNLFDRTKVTFLKEHMTVVNQRDLSTSLEQGIWQHDTLTFNNVLNTKGELNTNWIVPASKTWLKRYLTKIAV